MYFMNGLPDPPLRRILTPSVSGPGPGAVKMPYSRGSPVATLSMVWAEPNNTGVAGPVSYTSKAKSVVAAPHGWAHWSTIVTVAPAGIVPIVWIWSVPGPGSKSWLPPPPLYVPSQLWSASFPAAMKYATPAAFARSTACATTSSWKNGSVM
jgi:hypothetical protein